MTRCPVCSFIGESFHNLADSLNLNPESPYEPNVPWFNNNSFNSLKCIWNIQLKIYLCTKRRQFWVNSWLHIMVKHGLTFQGLCVHHNDGEFDDFLENTITFNLIKVTYYTLIYDIDKGTRNRLYLKTVI